MNRAHPSTSREELLTLPGLDAQNPLGFFAALGLLQVLDLHATRTGRPIPSLAFIDEGQQAAQVSTTLSYSEVKALILADAAEQAGSRALRLAYDPRVAVEPDAAGAVRDLKPPPTVARAFLDRLATSERRNADLAAACFSELVQDNNNNTKPTAFHFTAGQQTFLSMVEELRAGLTDPDIDESLLGPWTNKSTLPSLSWDATATRAYALRAGNPSKEKRGTVAAANWLAVHALAFFPVFPERGRLRTTGVDGGWKTSSFTWPVWRVPAAVRTIRALLRSRPAAWTARERAAAGIGLVLRAGILRSDQGGYGSFTPSAVLPPAPEASANPANPRTPT